MRADPTYRAVRRPTARTAPPHLNQRKANAAPRARDERFAVGVERRRRQRRFQQLRRDLLGDALIGCLLAMLALIVAPGLAVIAIASIPVTLAVAGTVVAERRSRTRHPGLSTSGLGASALLGQASDACLSSDERSLVGAD